MGETGVIWCNLLFAGVPRWREAFSVVALLTSDKDLSSSLAKCVATEAQRFSQRIFLRAPGSRSGELAWR